MNKFLILFLLFAHSLFSQNNIVKTAGISYTNGSPTFNPGASGSRVAIDTVTWLWYENNGSTWLGSGYRIQTISGCAAPAYVPTKYQSRLVINNCTVLQNGHGPELYHYTSSWICLNCVEDIEITAGSGITITGTDDITISANDASPTNELNTSFSVSGANLALTDAGGTINVPVISIAPDQSTTNEIQTLTLSGSDLSISGGNTITLPATGITSLNSQTGQTQNFATGTSGTNFAISSSGNTHTFNLPTASASNRGALASADWSVFNGKIGGSGTTNYVSKFTASGTVGNSVAYDNGTGIGINQATFTHSLHVESTNGSVARFRDATQAKNFDIFIGSVASTLGSNGQLIVSHTAPAGVFSLESGRFSTTYAEFRTATGSLAFRPTAVGTAGQYFSMDGYNGSWITGFKVANTTSGATVMAQIVPSGGNAVVGATSGTAKLSVVGSTGYNQLNLATQYTPTGSADALGANGDVSYDANYIYIKVGGSWKRAALSTF